jgi:phospholipase C
MPDTDPIEHVVVLMLENRSFDHMLGACAQINPEIDGIPAGSPARTNSYQQKDYPQEPGAKRIVTDDPRHETAHVLAQLVPGADGTPSGFVSDYATAYLHTMTEEDRGEVMKYHGLGTLPASHALAEHFAVCDRWFSSVPGPTWTNRLFAMSGTSLGRVEMPEGIIDLNLHWYDQTTLFDLLNQKSIDWRVYYGDAPLSLLLVDQWNPINAARHSSMTDFYADAATTTPDEFPQFAFIEPTYLDPGGNSAHPPHDILAAEALIARVYNALRKNEARWKKTLLVVLCDEHGGFYDHVQPPDAVPPDHHQDEYTFDRLGVRVPALLVSPLLPKTVIHDQFDHTSLLRYLVDKWELGKLTRRVDEATTFRKYILDEPRTDTPESIPATPQTVSRVIPPKQRKLSSHENGVVALTHALETMSGEDPAIVTARSQQMVSGAQSQIDVAVDRVEAFLRRQSAKRLEDAGP